MAMTHIKAFLRVMGQPIDVEALQSVLLTVEEAKAMNPVIPTANISANDGGAMIVESSSGAV